MLVAIAVGGALGTLARYGLDAGDSRREGLVPVGDVRDEHQRRVRTGRVPHARRSRSSGARTTLRAFFAVGFLGSFTTFSTMAVETVVLVKDGDTGLGIGYLDLERRGGYRGRIPRRRARALSATPSGVVVLIFGLIVAGVVGAPTRYLVDGFVLRRTRSTLPLGTLFINVTGSFILGVVTGLVLYHAFPSTPRTIIGTGFCGAYTTFSTFAYDTIHLAEEGRARRAAARVVVASLVLPALAAALGLALGHSLKPHSDGSGADQ